MLPLDVPIDLGREQAAALLRDELAQPVYAQAQPPLAQRVVQWLLEQAQEALERVVEAAPGGWFGVVGLVLLVALAVVAIRWRVGALGHAERADRLLFVGTELTAAEHRRRAESAAAAGAYADAVRERLRALVRDLEERGVLDPRPGRTADEVAREAARALPGEEAVLRRAVRVFDDVWYGGRPAGPAEYRVLAEADDRAHAAAPRRRATSGLPG
ncbi:MAG: DUF4129 domain-containing protein [Candidatus Nanopelagicales bacterium]